MISTGPGRLKACLTGRRIRKPTPPQLSTARPGSPQRSGSWPRPRGSRSRRRVPKKSRPQLWVRAAIPYGSLLAPRSPRARNGQRAGSDVRLRSAGRRAEAVAHSGGRRNRQRAPGREYGDGPFASGRGQHPLPKSPQPEVAGSPSELPKAPPQEPAPVVQEAKKLPPPGPAGTPDSASAQVNCALTPSSPSCIGALPPETGSGGGHNRPAPGPTARSPKPHPGDVPGRSYVIEGVRVPEQESAIRMCARSNLGSLRKLNSRSVIRLQRSGTLQVTSGPPVVLKSNLDVCLSQLFQNTPVKSLPEEVTIRLTK